jgi:probable rRNA maturation factor
MTRPPERLLPVPSPLPVPARKEPGKRAAKTPEERRLPGEISVSNRQKRVAVDSARIRRAARKILGELGLEGHELSVVIVGDPEITRLNRHYFRRNRPTNVISFPMAPGEVAAGPPPILGDVVISAETARRQAEERGEKEEDEMLFLLIHGILHLAGYDHEGSAGERRKMEEKERELFARFRDPSHGRSRSSRGIKKSKGATRGVAR